MRKTQQLIVLILLLAFSLETTAQTDYKAYYINVNKANTFKDTDSVLKYRLNALKFAKPLPNDLRSIAFYYYENNNIPKASYYFLEAIKNGYQIEPDEAFKDIPYKTEYDFGFISKYENSSTSFASFIIEVFNKK